jgi:hypothetical protein
LWKCYIASSYLMILQGCLCTAIVGSTCRESPSLFLPFLPCLFSYPKPIALNTTSRSSRTTVSILLSRSQKWEIHRKRAIRIQERKRPSTKIERVTTVTLCSGFNYSLSRLTLIRPSLVSLSVSLSLSLSVFSSH